MIRGDSDVLAAMGGSWEMGDGEEKRLAPFILKPGPANCSQKSQAPIVVDIVPAWENC